MILKFSSRTGLLSMTLASIALITACSEQGEQASAPADAPAESAAAIELETQQQKVTYIVGYNMAEQANANGLDFDKNVMAMAIQDVADGTEPRIPQADQQQIMMAFQEEQQSKRQEEQNQVAEANLEKSQAFLTENAGKEGVMTTESGLQYKVMESGEEGAEQPGADDTVEVHYHGTLIDGTVFDSSVERGEPVQFPVSGVIPGWVEALQLMKVGDKYQLYIPPDLAYGPGGTSGKIGPNDALIFDVELLAVNPGQETEGATEGAAEEAPASE